MISFRSVDVRIISFAVFIGVKIIERIVSRFAVRNAVEPQIFDGVENSVGGFSRNATVLFIRFGIFSGFVKILAHHSQIEMHRHIGRILFIDFYQNFNVFFLGKINLISHIFHQSRPIFVFKAGISDRRRVDATS